MRRQLIHATLPRLTKEKKTITPRPTVTVSPKRRKASARISRKAGGGEEKTEVKRGYPSVTKRAELK